MSSNVIAFDDEYIKNNLTEDSYDILISKEDVVSDVKSINFDKPNLILSNITLSDNIDGNGTIVINNIT